MTTDPKDYYEFRQLSADHLQKAVNALSTWLDDWHANEIPGDAIEPPEYPFHLSLDELVSQIHSSIDSLQRDFCIDGCGDLATEDDDRCEACHKRAMRVPARIKIHRDTSSGDEFVWYYTVEHPVRQEDALDYGSCSTWETALGQACDTLQHQRDYSPLREYRAMVTAFGGSYHPDTDPEEYFLDGNTGRRVVDKIEGYTAERITQIEDWTRRCGYDLYAEALKVTQEALQA